MTPDGIAKTQSYEKVTDEYMLSDGKTFDDCFAWCSEQRSLSPDEGYTACEGEGMLCSPDSCNLLGCTLYKNIVITESSADTDLKCWDFSPGKFVKLTLNMI